jgi:PAS domain S-box-containing protein
MPGGTTTYFGSEFIREHRDEILAEWERAVRTMPLARQLDRPALIDDIPGLLDRIAQLGDELEDGAETPRIDPVSENHGLQRLGEGFDVAQLVIELGILRDSITRLWEERVADPTRRPELRRLNLAVDSTLASSIRAFTTAREERAAMELRERELELRSLADNIPQLIWMADGSGKISWYNKRWFDYTGTSLDDMRSATAELVRPDHVGRVTESKRQAISTGTPWEDTFPLRGRNGRYRWFLGRAIPIRDARGVIAHWVGTLTDITEQRFLDEATKLLNSSLNYHETLDQLAHLAVPDLADWCVVDLVEESGEVRRMTAAHADPDKLEWARAWERRFRPKWSPDFGVGKVIRTGEPELATDVTDAKLVAIADSEEYLAALRGIGLSSYITVPLVARGRTFGAITLIAVESRRHYTTADVEVAQELGRRAGIAVDNARLYQESQQALRDREEAVRSRDEVLAIVSHDLRNPLGAIGLSTSSLLHEPANAPCSRKPLQVIQRSADRMEHMIDELLDMATIQAKGLALNLTPEEPGPLMTSIVEAHEAMATAKGIKLVAERDLPPVQMMVDRDRVEQVFANLIGNAIKYCRRGDTIYVRGRVADGQPRFSIADTGPGISPVDLPHLFEPYWAVKHHDTKKGTGLGLYICKGIVEAHGGRLWVESKLGEGTTFYFTLQPAAKAA